MKAMALAAVIALTGCGAKADHSAERIEIEFCLSCFQLRIETPGVIYYSPRSERDFDDQRGGVPTL